MSHFNSLILLVLLFKLTSFQESNNLLLGNGTVMFISDAPLETIEASSDKLRGLIDLSKKTFAFSLQVNTFEGFNSPLQKEHFNEHYLESRMIPKATFTGNIIGEFDCSKDCEVEFFAKGKMTIHGVTKVIILPIKFNKTSKDAIATSFFDVLLSDYNITIPKILDAKISPTIKVQVNVKFTEDE